MFTFFYHIHEARVVIHYRTYDETLTKINPNIRYIYIFKGMCVNELKTLNI